MKIPIFSSPTDPIEVVRVHKQRNWLAHSLLVGSFTLWPLHLWLKNRPASTPQVETTVAPAFGPVAAPSTATQPANAPDLSGFNGEDRDFHGMISTLPSSSLPIENPAARDALKSLSRRYERMQSYSDAVTVRTFGDRHISSSDGVSEDQNRNFNFYRDRDNTRIEDPKSSGLFLGVRNKGTLQYRLIHPAVEKKVFPSTEVGSSSLAGWMFLTSPGIYIVSGEGLTAPDKSFAPSGEKDDWLRRESYNAIATFSPDEEVESVLCHVINLRDKSGNQWDERAHRLYRDYQLCYSTQNGLLRQVRFRSTGEFYQVERIETHSSIRVNPQLPASTWDFVGS